MAQLGAKCKSVSRGTEQGGNLRAAGQEKAPRAPPDQGGNWDGKARMRRPKEKSRDEGGGKRAELHLSTALAPTSLDAEPEHPPATGERFGTGQGQGTASSDRHAAIPQKFPGDIPVL